VKIVKKTGNYTFVGKIGKSV